MTTRRRFLTTGTMVATAAVLAEGVTACATTEPAPPGPAVGHVPPGAGANGSMPDDTRPFIEVSALLTGLPLLNDRVLIEPMAREYVRRLRGTFGDDFTALLRAYASLLDGAARPGSDDALLKKLRATPEFRKNEALARQIVNIWYLSQFKDGTDTVIDGGFYEHGYVWSVIKAPPPGFSTKGPGYWTVHPAHETL